MKGLSKYVKQVIWSMIFELFHDGGRNHIETSPLICSTNQWTGFYMISASIMKGLISCFFIKYLWILVRSIISEVLWLIEKLYTHPFNEVFFMLLTEKSLKRFPRHNGCIFIFFTLIWNIFVPLTNKKLLLPLWWRLKIFFLILEN